MIDSDSSLVAAGVPTGSDTARGERRATFLVPPLGGIGAEKPPTMGTWCAGGTTNDIRPQAMDVSPPPLAVLRRFARGKTVASPVEKCELCSNRLPSRHGHLVDLRTRRLVCCCEACGTLFSGRQNAAYRRVPRVILALPGFRISDAQWDSLLIPINLAFFYRPLDKGREEGTQDGEKEDLGKENEGQEGCGKIVAVYPSPAGPVESLLGLEAWQAIVAENPRLAALQPEVEALLVDRLAGDHRYFIVPIDEAYRLSGLIRRHWRGLSGGSEVWEEVGQFFQQLEERACLI